MTGFGRSLPVEGDDDLTLATLLCTTCVLLAIYSYFQLPDGARRGACVGERPKRRGVERAAGVQDHLSTPFAAAKPRQIFGHIRYGAIGRSNQHDIGSEDAAVRRLALEPRGDVHAVAEDVVTVDDDVAQVHADAENGRNQPVGVHS